MEGKKTGEPGPFDSDSTSKPPSWTEVEIEGAHADPGPVHDVAHLDAVQPRPQDRLLSGLDQPGAGLLNLDPVSLGVASHPGLHIDRTNVQSNASERWVCQPGNLGKALNYPE